MCVSRPFSSSEVLQLSCPAENAQKLLVGGFYMHTRRFSSGKAHTYTEVYKNFQVSFQFSPPIDNNPIPATIPIDYSCQLIFADSSKSPEIHQNAFRKYLYRIGHRGHGYCTRFVPQSHFH
jgi:hypothetical protein